MADFVDLLPTILPVVAEVADAPPYGHIARLDNGLYFETTRIPSYLIWHKVLELRFLGFPGSEHSFLTPPLPAVGRVSCVWWGMHISPRGGIRDTKEGRADLRRVQKALGANVATMAVFTAKPDAKYLVTTWESHHLEPEDPHRWVAARFIMAPKGLLGIRGYDWTDLGRRIVANKEDICRVLASASSR